MTTQKQIRKGFLAVAVVGLLFSVTGVRAADWTPTDLGGSLALWFDASDAGTVWANTNATVAAGNGDVVARWDDKSGRGLHLVQTNSAARPVFRGATFTSLVSFDGVDDFLAAAAPFVNSSNFNAYVVFREDVRQNGSLWSLGSNIQTHAPYGSGTAYFDVGSVNSPNRISGAWPLAAGTRCLTTWRNSVGNTIQSVSVNGQAPFISDTTGHSFAVSYFNLGKYSTFFACASVSEVILTSADLSASDRQNVETYLTQKWLRSYTWTGGASGNWTADSNNWNAATTPLWDSVNGPPSSAVFNTANAVVKVNTNLFVKDVTFSASTTITNNANPDAINLTSGATLTLASGKTATLYCPVSGQNITINQNGGDNYNLCLYGSNTFTGTVSIRTPGGAQGYVVVAGPWSLGTATWDIGNTAADQACLSLPVGYTYTNTFILRTVPSGGRGRLVLSGTLTMSGPVQLADNSQVWIYNDGVGTISGNITGPYALAFYAYGGGGVKTLHLSGANSFTGGVTVTSQWPDTNYGNLSAGSSNAFNSTAGQENFVDFKCIGKLTLNGYSLTLSGVSNMNVYAYGNVIQNNSSTNATLTVGNAQNRNSVYSGLIQNGTGGGTLSLAKAGTGTLTLVNTNQYTGATTVRAGTLAMTNAVKSATWAVSNSATLKVIGAVSLSGKTLNVATGGGTAGLLQVNGNLTLGGTLTVNATNEVTTQVTLAECTGGGTISGGVGAFASASLPINTLLKISNDSTKLLLIKKPKGTMISIF